MLNNAPEIGNRAVRRVNALGLSVHAEEGGMEGPDLVFSISVRLKRVDQTVEVARMFHAIVISCCDAMCCEA